MDYLNIHRRVVGSEVMQDASPSAVRAWLFMAKYCAGEENGGRIPGAKSWSDRKWLKMCGLARKVVHQETGLWRWEGEDLVLRFYPLEQEAKFRANRELGARAGRRSGEARRVKSDQNQSEREADGSSESEATVERKEKEKEKENNVKEAVHTQGDVSDQEVIIPSESEVRTWAELAGVDPEYAVERWHATSEDHAWEKNGLVIDWRHKWKRYWEADKVGWSQKKNLLQKKRAHPEGRAEGDQDWWWDGDVETLERALFGAVLAGNEKSAARIREILKVRKGM